MENTHSHDGTKSCRCFQCELDDIQGQFDRAREAKLIGSEYRSICAMVDLLKSLKLALTVDDRIPTVDDLIKHYADKEAAIEQKHGLRRSYGKQTLNEKKDNNDLL